MKHTITRQQMEVFGQLLETIKQQETLSRDEFDELHTQFHGEDAGGTRWTVGIHTRTWNRREQGQWVAGAPPEELQMEAGVATALWELLSKQWAAGGSPAPVENPVCNRCGAQLKPGKRFCSVCGSPAMAAPTAPGVPAERRCPRCGQLVPVRKKFCTTCGTPF